MVLDLGIFIKVVPGMKPTLDIIHFCLPCLDAKVGGVIGKAGTIIRNLRQESSFDIKVLEGIYDSEDYIILISGPAVWFASSKTA